MTALEFASIARNLGEVAHRFALKSPAFRAPPRDPNLLRSVMWYDGGPVVAVTIRDRSDDEVITDMVLGLLIANRLDATDPRAPEIARWAREGRQGPVPAQESI